VSAATPIAELAEDRVVEGVFAVARKQRLRTKSGSPYLALELVDPSGRIEARVWSDVELLEQRFGEGDAVRVLGRVERFRDRLQLDVRTVERAEGADPAAFAPAARRDLDELDGFLEFLAEEIAHRGLRVVIDRFVGDSDFRARLRTLPATPDGHHSYAATSCSPLPSSTTPGACASSTGGRSSFPRGRELCSATSSSAYG
jgi:3'-5' exoribonuclease